MRTIILFIAILAAGFSIQAQPTKNIQLKNEPLGFTPAHFYISSVKDDRPDTITLGTMHTLGGLKKVTAVLKNGAAATISQYMENNIDWNRSMPAVEMHITQLALSENNTAMQQQLQIDGRASFYLDGKAVYDLSYTSFARGMNVESYAPILVKEFLKGVLKEFDGWFEKNKDNARSSFTVEAEMLHTTDDEDLVVYDAAQPLKRNYFAGTPDDLSMAGAITFSGILIKYQQQGMLNSQQVKITILPYFDKSRSWWVAKESEAAVLSHEQVHFDITAIAACELLHTIKSYAFSAENFVKELDIIQKQSEKKRSQMQQDYDRETHHGQNAAKQAEWKNKVKALLAQQDCY